MDSRWCALCLTGLVVACFPSIAQTPAVKAPAKADYSQEAAVIEGMSTKVAFDNDGNFTREQTSRVRVQTDAGVQQWGLLTFPFQSATQTVEIDYVRVRKADGNTVATPPENAQDLDSEITRSAPFYSDLREKHVAVKGLGKGDILEYEAHWRTTKPLIAGQFWFQYNFHHDGIVLSERLEIEVPLERVIKVKGPLTGQTVTTEASTRNYTWTFSKLQNASEPENNEQKQVETALGRLPPPDVQVSSFQNWEDVGRWYWNLQKDRIEPTPAIRAKAAELTKGLRDDVAKMKALYGFVSTQYRYIGIAFGIGRYQPHAADDVLTNNYGDCKDKHTLLASLLQASGITVHPALISSSSKIDADVPSPAQFDHVIGYMLQGKEALWLDTTPEVAPFGFLVVPLRNKQALVMEGEKSIRLVTTPIDPPFPSIQNFRIDATLSDDGTLVGKVEDKTRGDNEVAVRTAFRRIPQPQWKDLVQQISYGLGYAGTVSDVSASTPESIGDPFHFSYSYNRKDYPSWKTDHEFTVPGLPFYMPAVQDDAKNPVWLGAPMEMVSDSTVELPRGYKALLLPNVDLKYDFGEYHASYLTSKDQNILIAKRRLLTKLHEVPLKELDDYRSFVKNLQNDLNRYAQTSSSNASSAISQGPGAHSSFLERIAALPASESEEANRLEHDAQNSATGSADRSEVAAMFKRAVEVDPKFTRAWLELATMYRTAGKIDAALDAARTAIDSDPKQLMARKMYAFLLTNLRRLTEARDAWHEALTLDPYDFEANSEMGSLLMQQGKYGEALPYIETVVKDDDSPSAQLRLGHAYIRAGQTERGVAVLEKIAEADQAPEILNDVAYELADADTDVPKALIYALHAVNVQETESQNVKLSTLLTDDVICTRKIEMFWDTLGWVHFRLGHLDQAESYLRAAWLLSQNAVEAVHLGQVYEQQKKTEQAAHMYRLALATPEGRTPNSSSEETRQRLERLTGTKAPTAVDLLRGDSGGTELSQLRTVKLKRLVPGNATAEFFLIFRPGPKIEAVEFINGSEPLKNAGEAALAKTNFQVSFPQHSTAQLVRRGILMCSSVSGCQAVLFTADSVKSVQ